MRAQKFVSEIAVAMFDVHEIETETCRGGRRAMEVLDDRADLTVAQQRKFGAEPQPPVEDRMVIEDSRLRTLVRIGTAVAARVGELQADQQAVVGARGLSMLRDENLAQM